MRKWWRRFKNRMGWDFKKKSIGQFLRKKEVNEPYWQYEAFWVTDPNGCYVYICKYCGLYLTFPWRETHLAYHNMQRHIKAKHL